MTDDFDLKAYEEGLRLSAAAMTNEELAAFLLREVRQCAFVVADTCGFKPGDEDKVHGALIEASKRLTQAAKTIDTAPKDGTVVDLWVLGERLADCLWFDDEESGLVGWRQQYSEAPSSSHPVDGAPTHWMPRPAPPSS